MSFGQYGVRGLGMLDEEDELEQRRRADELAGFSMGSPDAWLTQEADKNPTWMRKQPDMSIGTFEAEQAPDMEIGLDEAEARPDMEFSVEEAERPDMQFSLEEAERPDMEFSEVETDTTPDPNFRPDMEFSLEETEAQHPEQFASTSAPLNLGGYQSTAPSTYAEQDVTPMQRGLGDIGQRWADAENNALDQSNVNGPEEYGIGEGLRDFLPMAAGLGLDIAFNKGRGVGNVAAGGMQAISQENVRRDRKAQQQTENALAVRRQRQYEADNSLRGRETDLGYLNLEERRATNARLGQRQDFDINPNNPAAAAMASHVQPLTGVDQTGLSTKQQGQAMALAGGEQRLRNAPLEEAARTKAELDTEHELAPRTAGDKGMEAAAVESIKRPEVLATEQGKRDVANPAIDEGGAAILPPGITDDGRFAIKAKRNPDAATQVTNTISDLGKLEALTKELIPIRAAIDKIPLENRRTNNKQFMDLVGQWDESEGAYQAAVFAGQDRGAPQVYEDKRFQGQIGKPMSWEEAAEHPIDAVKSALKDQKAMLDGRLKSIQGRRAIYIESQFGPQRRAAAGGGGGRENLGTTGGRKVSDTPKIPAAAPPQGDSLPIPKRMANGSFDIDGETYTEDQVQKLIRMGLVGR